MILSLFYFWDCYLLMEELSGYNDEEGFLCHITSVLVHSKYGHVLRNIVKSLKIYAFG